MGAGISTLGQYLDQISRLKSQQQSLNDLSVQISSGRKTQKLSGLGNEILKTTRARTGLNSLEVYIDNIKNADRRINLMQASIHEIKNQSRNISGALTTSIKEGDYPDLEGIKKMAQNIYNFVLDSINQNDGEKYLFGGADTSEKPILDTGLLNSTLGAFVPDSSDLTNPPLVASGMIGDWGDGTITTDEFIAAYHDISDTTLGFSNALTTGTAGKSVVSVTDTSEFDYTTLANDTAMRDIVLVLGILKELPPVEYAPGALNDPLATTIAADTEPHPPAEKQENFFKVLKDLTSTLNKAITNLDQASFNLSQVQAQIQTIEETHVEQVNAYKDIIGEVEDTDITEASAKLLQIQTQLQASFQVTALVSQLTLANFLD